MSLDTSIVGKSTPVQVEVLFAVIVGFLIVANLAITDITFHDFYVLPAIETCFPTNQEEFCRNIRDRMDLPNDAQLEIGDVYWSELARQGIFVGFILFSIRIGIAYLLDRNGIRKIRASTILIAIFWGVTGAGVFFFGYVDTFYYLIQNETIPSELSWLNEAGIFTETRSFTGDPNVVEFEDLVLTNILGLVVLGTFAVVIMYTYANSGMKNRGIA